MPPKKRGLEEVEEEKGGGGAAGAGPPSPALKKRCRSFDLEIRGCRHLQELASTCVQSVQIRLDAALESVVARIPEEVTKALTNFFSRVPRTLVDQNRPPRYKINFMNGLSNEVFTKKVIRSTDGEPLKICMAVNEPQGTIPRRLLSAKIKIVVLDGDFNRHNQESWESEEFRNYIVRPRDKAGAVLTGVPELSLKNGEACLPGATFIDNSKFVRSGQFRLGVMVDEQDLDERVLEGITEPFIVKDRRGEGNRKHDIPMLNDDVWRLKKISKGGVFHVALRGRHIFSVKDLLRLYYKDEQALREILIKATDLVWTTIIEHAKKCDPGRELYSFPVEANNVTLFFNSVYQIVGATFNGDYMPFCDLDKSEKDLVGQWSKDAYKNMTYDQPDYEIENGKPRQINQGVFQGLSMQGHIGRSGVAGTCRSSPPPACSPYRSGSRPRSSRSSQGYQKRLPKDLQTYLAQFLDGEPLKICMAVNEPQGTIPRRLLSAKIKIVVLDGDFNRHNQESWESEEFRNYIVRPRDKAGAVLTGVPELSLKNGEACLPGATFIDNSKFVRSGQFRLGVMVDEQDLDERVLEGITEPFIVKDRRGEGNRKHDIPMLNDDVWRLKKISKGGVFHVALRGRHIFSVKDLLRLYYKDEQALREILIKATDLVWTTIIEHAKKCDPGRELYSFPVEANNVTLFFNSVYQIVGATFNGDYMPFCDLDKSEKDLVGQWSKDAYKNMTYDQPDYEIENGKPRQINQGVFQGLSMQGHIERNVCQPDDQQGNSGNNSKQCKLKRLGSVRVTQNNESYFGPEKDKSFDFSFLLDSTLEAQCCASTSTNGIAGLVTLHCSAAAANGITGASLTMDHEEYDIPFTENDAAVPQLNEEKQPEQDHFASPLCSAKTLAGFYSRLSSFNESDYLEMPAMGAEPSM